MGIHSSRVLRVRHELQAIRRTGSETSAGLRRIQAQVAQLVLRSLSDKFHPIQEELAQLLNFRTIVQSENSEAVREQATRVASPPDAATLTGNADQRASKKAVRTFRAERVLFMPQPGSSSAAARNFWPLQLLLQTAARSAEHAGKLAEHLKLTPAQLGTLAQEGARFSVDLWSTPQWVNLLDVAIETLDYPDPPLPFQLEGRNVTGRNGNSFRLSRQEAVFVQLLVDHLNTRVSHDELRASGIKAPVKVKGEIAKKFRSANVELPLTSDEGAYILHESIS